MASNFVLQMSREGVAAPLNGEDPNLDNTDAAVCPEM